MSQLDARIVGSLANLPVDQATLLSGEDQTANLIVVENRYNYKNLATNATSVVKGTPGFLHSLTINKYGATGNTITIYDGTDATGTVIATIDSTAAGNPTRLYNVQFALGLTVVIGTGTAADITVSYR